MPSLVEVGPACRDAQRRADIFAHPVLNGIDFVEYERRPLPLAPHVLVVTFLKPLPDPPNSNPDGAYGLTQPPNLGLVVAAARSRSEEFAKAMAAAGSPPVVEPDPQTFHLGVRVTGKDVHLGLPGVIAQVTAPRDSKTVLAQGMTDRDGNALLAVPAARASEGTKADATLEILSVAGKSLQRLPGAVCIRPNQADTKVVSLKDSADTAPLKSVALEMRSQQQARARELLTSIDRLTKEREARLRDLDYRLEDTRKTIADLEETDPTAPPADPSAEPATRPPQAARPKRSGRQGA